MYNTDRIPWLAHVYSSKPRPLTLVDSRSDLELKFPRVLEEIIRLWKTPQIVQFVDDLVMDWRGNRNGFPPEVVDELMMLNGVLFNLTLNADHFFPRATDSEFSFAPKKAPRPAAHPPTPPKHTTLMRITKLFKNA